MYHVLLMRNCHPAVGAAGASCSFNKSIVNPKYKNRNTKIEKSGISECRRLEVLFDKHRKMQAEIIFRHAEKKMVKLIY